MSEKIEFDGEIQKIKKGPRESILMTSYLMALKFDYFRAMRHLENSVGKKFRITMEEIPE